MLLIWKINERVNIAPHFLSLRICLGQKDKLVFTQWLMHTRKNKNVMNQGSFVTSLWGLKNKSFYCHLGRCERDAVPGGSQGLWGGTCRFTQLLRMSKLSLLHYCLPSSFPWVPIMKNFRTSLDWGGPFFLFNWYTFICKYSLQKVIWSGLRPLVFSVLSLLGPH